MFPAAVVLFVVAVVLFVVAVVLFVVAMTLRGHRPTSLPVETPALRGDAWAMLAYLGIATWGSASTGGYPGRFGLIFRADLNSAESIRS